MQRRGQKTIGASASGRMNSELVFSIYVHHYYFLETLDEFIEGWQVKRDGTSPRYHRGKK